MRPNLISGQLIPCRILSPTDYEPDAGEIDVTSADTLSDSASLAAGIDMISTDTLSDVGADVKIE